MFGNRKRQSTLKTTSWLLAAGLLTAACAGSQNRQAPTVDSTSLAAHACLAVDGSAHGELRPNMGAQFDAQAADRERAAGQAKSAALANPKYGPMAAAIAKLAVESTDMAGWYRTDPERFAKEAVGSGAGSPVIQALLAARTACRDLKLATK